MSYRDTKIFTGNHWAESFVSEQAWRLKNSDNLGQYDNKDFELF